MRLLLFFYNERGDYWVVNVNAETLTPDPEPEPTNGFAAGGGWFHSPQGALTADAFHQGRAHFAFRARQEEKDQQPKGHFILYIPDAGFRFISTTFEWIQVDGNKALKEAGSWRNSRVIPSCYRLRMKEED